MGEQDRAEGYGLEKIANAPLTGLERAALALQPLEGLSRWSASEAARQMGAGR